MKNQQTRQPDYLRSVGSHMRGNADSRHAKQFLKAEEIIVRFHFLTAATMKFRVFWDVVPCSVVGVDRRFRGEG
jgi:hypothetical protein